MSPVWIAARPTRPAAFKFACSLSCGLGPGPKCCSYYSPNRSNATTVVFGRASSTMMEDLPVPAPISSTRPVPDRRKFCVGNGARPFTSSTKRAQKNAAKDQTATAPSTSIGYLDQLGIPEQDERDRDCDYDEVAIAQPPRIQSRFGLPASIIFIERPGAGLSRTVKILLPCGFSIIW